MRQVLICWESTASLVLGRLCELVDMLSFQNAAAGAVWNQHPAATLKVFAASFHRPFSLSIPGKLLKANVDIH